MSEQATGRATVTRTFRVTRFDPEQDAEPRTESYQVPCEPEWQVLDAVNYIKDELDPTVTHRWSCRMAVCGSCGMTVNGQPRLTCKAPLREYGDTVEVAPLANFPIVRDLVVELEGFMEKFRAVKPWIIRAKERALAEGTHRQSPRELSHFKRFSACINCMLCYSACPVISHEPDFLGPAVIALGHRYNLDSRDEGARERYQVFRDDGGVYSCSYANECSEVCPKNVDPAGAIQQSKMLATLDWVKGLVLPLGRG
ncbi:MAG: succinate dehydrogenase iron-sulfur subunit [Myxococcota bacterium]